MSGGRFESFLNNRWLVFVAAMWVQSGSGIGYLFGSLSPIVKTSLSYNQKQIASLGIAKDLGGGVGFTAGSLSEKLPLWGLLLVGSAHTFVGYGWIWLIVTGRTSQLPLWAMWILMYIASNGETYYNTAVLVSCVHNFPKSRGPVVGVLKGFSGLSGAILTQAFGLIHTSDRAALILMVAAGPPILVVSLMFFIRFVGCHTQVGTSDNFSFRFVYSICLLLAAYLMFVMLLEDFVKLSYTSTVIVTTGLFFLLLLPISIPLMLSCCANSITSEPLIPETEGEEASILLQSSEEQVSLIEAEHENSKEADLLPAYRRQNRNILNKRKSIETIESSRSPTREESFTLAQSLTKVEFWLIFVSLMLSSGSGLTVMDNLGQMSGSLGYEDSRIFVSLISIWNFLGRIGGGFFSEIVVRNYSFPRPIALAIAQIVMAIGHFILAMAWPGALYISTLLVGLGYGAHWAIVTATTSELFGLKNFGALYNFVTVANPAGSLVFSGLIASTIYDYEAEQQAKHPQNILSSLGLSLGAKIKNDEPLECVGAVCFVYTLLLMCGFCIVAAILSVVLVYRTRNVYTNLYGNARR